jgi:phage gpG-like protein
MPDSSATIEIEGLDELIRKLNDLSKLRKVHAGIKAGALYVKGKIATYPPSTEANVPKNFPGGRWYQRGWGAKYYTRKGVKGYPTSENLGKKWTIKYNQNKFEATVGNNVSYARFVQGNEQAGFHKKRGWKTTDTVAKEETKRVQEYVFDAVRRAIGA